MEKKARILFLAAALMLLGTASGFAAAASDTIGVLITEWGTPARYIFEYSWDNNYWCRVGDLTEYEGQPCKINHVGKFVEVDGMPYSMESHLGLMPWSLNHKYPGFEFTYDRSGIYKLENGFTSPSIPRENHTPLRKFPTMLP